MESIPDISNNEYNIAVKLNKLGFLPGPIICKCGNKNFTIQIDNSRKTSNIVWRCTNYKCRAKINIKINSFFDYFSKLTLYNIYEVIKCFICFNFNKKKAFEYLTKEKNINISLKAIKEIYQKIRYILYRYYYILYQSEYLGPKDSQDCYAIDESLFTHTKNGTQVWVIGIINNRTKEFRLEASKYRDTNTIKKFLYKFIDSGNIIISDGWSGYNFISNFNGLAHEVHNHGAWDFGLGMHTTSFIESLWSSLKSQIKNTYHIIPSRYFISFLREAEWKISNKNKNYESLLNEFFACYDYIQNLSDIDVNDNSFLSDGDLSDEEIEIISEDN